MRETEARLFGRVLAQGPMADGSQPSGPHPVARPQLIGWRDDRQPRAVALLLHGGPEESDGFVAPAAPDTWPMIPLARRIRRWSHGDLAPVRLVNSVAGWNGTGRTQRADTDWALDRVARLYPGLPIALVGHSMGGRVAFSFAADPRVSALVGLAPWRSDEFDAQDFASTPLYLLHGKWDPVTSADASRELVERITLAGGRATFDSVHGTHLLMLRSGSWQHRVTTFLESTLVGRTGTAVAGE